MNIYRVSWQIGEDKLSTTNTQDFESEVESYEAFKNLQEDFRDEGSFCCWVEHIRQEVIHFFDICERDFEDEE